MKKQEAHNAFDALVEAVQADGIPREVTLRARPVIDSNHHAETINVRKNPDLPEGTVPAEPDSLALELFISGAPGTMVGSRVLEVAAEHNLQIASSDVLLT